jgi:predicted ATPase
VALVEQIQRVQAQHGFPVDEMALRAESEADRPERPAVASGGVHRNIGNLPLELTSFVGRSGELSAVKNLLAASRLVTLTGIGGVGKSRLALRVAFEARRDFADGVWLVELGELRDGSLLVDVVAAALGLRDHSPTPLRDVLMEFLFARKLLLVLDNCEQVVDAAAELIEMLLRACPDVRILATSREAFGIGGESMLQVSPLAVPDDPEQTPGGHAAYDAVALFAERAAAAVPGYELTEDNKATVARICSRLDGLPLAIELAAARLRAMSAEQILERLADEYALLTHGSRRAPRRQQTLSQSVGWSYDLCTPAEQQLWGRLSVFAGSFELNAAEDICGGDPISDDLIELLSSLVDKSILTRAESKGVVRFRLLGTLRDYGRQRIGDEYQELRRRHLEWYQRLALDADADWFSSHEIDWINLLERELPNLREALEFALSEEDDSALGMAAALSAFWITRGLLSEGRRWLERALARAPHEPTPTRAKALYGISVITALQSDLTSAAARVAEGRALAEGSADPAVHALVTVADGLTSLMGGDLDRASSCLGAAVGKGGELIAQAGMLLLVGWAHDMRGDTDEALSWFENGLALTESRGESVYRTYALWSIGIAKWRRGEHEDAQRLLKQGLRLAHRVNDPRMAAACLESIAWIAVAAGDPRLAVVLTGAAAVLNRSVGSPTAVFPHLLVHHQESENRARQSLGTQAFDAALHEGASLGFDGAVNYALGESAD